MPHLEIIDVVSIHCDISTIINYQQGKRVLHTLIPNKPFGQLPDISPKSFVF